MVLSCMMALVWDHRFMVIVEVKIQHMPEAWWQLEAAYRPILQAAAPKADIYCLEVCRSYDPEYAISLLSAYGPRISRSG